MGFEYRLSWHYHFGRIAFAFCLAFFGYNILVQGKEFYVPYLHAARRFVLPESKNRINESLTYEDVFVMVVQAMGGIMMLGAFLIGLNQRAIGGVFCILAILMMIGTQDNPLLID